MGELFGFGGAWLKDGAGFHGMMNYYFRTALVSWLNGELGAAQVNGAVSDAREAYGLPGLLCSWTMLSSHDTPRLRNALPGPGRVALALLAQMTLPGVPLLYYGEETGMEGGPDPANRGPMVWEETRWDTGQRDRVRQLLAIRRQSPALRHGDVVALGQRLPGDALVFLRFTEVPGEAALVVINASPEPLRAKLLLPYAHWYDGVPLRDALGHGPDTRVLAGGVQLDVGPNTGMVYQAYEPFKHYRYFKPNR